MLAFYKREYSALPMQSARIAQSRESNLDSCRPMSLGSYRLESRRDLQTANKVCGLYPFSPERETCCILPVNQLSRAYFLTKWKKCNIVSLFLQIHIVESTIPRRSSVPLSLQKGAAYGMLPICKAFVCLPFYKRLFHIPLQSSWGGTRPLSVSSSSILSFIQTYNILLSTIRQADGGEYSTFSEQFRRNCMVSCSRLAVFKRVLTTVVVFAQ